MTAEDFFNLMEKHITDNTEDGNYLIDSNMQDSELMKDVVDELRYAFILHQSGLLEGITPCHQLLMMIIRKNTGLDYGS